MHRDLKPANIKLKPDGTVKVLDFGIAKALDSRATTGPGPAALTTPAMTEAGFVLGTAAYMSPEQAKGKFVDQRTDIWAFGCVLYEMLTGKAAFLGEDVTSTLARVLEVAANLNALPSGVSPSVRRTLELCLEKDARKRIADMRDVKLALAGAFALGGPAAPLWRRALPFAATLVVGSLLASVYFLGSRPPAAPANVAAPAPMSRFVITPPATAPLANQGWPRSRDLPGWEADRLSGRQAGKRQCRALRARARCARGAADSGHGSAGHRGPGTRSSRRTESPSVISLLTAASSVSAIDGRPPIKIADRPNPDFTGGWWAGDNTVIYSSGDACSACPPRGAARPSP